MAVHAHAAYFKTLLRARPHLHMAKAWSAAQSGQTHDLVHSHGLHEQHHTLQRTCSNLWQTVVWEAVVEVS